MRISDWSSDVCSSDLQPCGGPADVRRKPKPGSLLAHPGSPAIPWATGNGQGVALRHRTSVEASPAEERETRRDLGVLRRLSRYLAPSRLSVDRKSTRLNSRHE